MDVAIGQGVVGRVFAHALETRGAVVPCWSYVTDGLAAHGQPELVFTLVRPADAGAEGAAEEPLQLLGAIAGLAAQGRLVFAGDYTELGAQGLLGRPSLRGLAYETAWPMHGVTMPPGTLSAVALVGHEMDTVKRYGSLRVLARLGRASAFFPTASWCVPDREPLMGPESGTVLEGVASARFHGVTATLEGDRIVLGVARRSHAQIAQQLPALPPEAACALFASLSPIADACLVWSPGQRAPEAISPQGSQGAHIAGCFALFVPQQQADGGNPFEDGFAIMLSDASWARLRDALVAGHAVDVPAAAPEMKGVRLAWHD